MVEDVGIYYGLKSRYKSALFEFDSIDGCSGVSKALISSHIPFGVTGSFYKLNGYRALIIPMLSDENDDFLRILDYVSAGGKIYLSGARHERLLSALMGAELLSYSAEAPVYVAPISEQKRLLLDFNAKYPLPFNSHAPIVRGINNGTTLAEFTLPYTNIYQAEFASIHSNPPGVATHHPAIVEGKFGLGKFIWSALPIEAIDMDEYRDIFLNILNRLLGDEPPSFITDAPKDVEITLFEDGCEMYISAVHLLESSVMPTLSPFEIGVLCSGDIEKIEALPECEKIPFEFLDGYARFKTLPMHVFSYYRITLKK